MTTGNTIALTIRTFVCKVISLLFNMLSRFVIAFLPRSKCLNFMAAVTVCSDLGAQRKYNELMEEMFLSTLDCLFSIWHRSVCRTLGEKRKQINVTFVWLIFSL